MAEETGKKQDDTGAEDASAAVSAVSSAAEVMGEVGATEGEVPAAAKKKIRGGRSIPMGIAHVRASFNNTQVVISDPKGGVISWSSAGRAGFKGSRKSTAFAATMVAQEAGRAAAARGMHEVEVRLQGAGAGRESAVRGLQSAGLSVSVIQDVTPVAHNGCRARKRRRV